MSKEKIIFFLLNLFVFGACTTPYINKSASLIDSKFQLKKIAKAKTTHTSSRGVRTYQKVLSDVLGSDCTQYPTDSQYAQLLSRKCGTAIFAVKSFSRFLQEPDASYLGMPVVNIDNKIHYKDFEVSCELF